MDPQNSPILGLLLYTLHETLRICYNRLLFAV